MTEFLNTKLFPLLKDNKIVVLPTEESARAIAVEYVSSTGNGLLAEQVISFDRFSELFQAEVEGESVSDYDRYLFSVWFTETYGDKLSYFYSPSYPEMKAFFPQFFASILSQLADVFCSGTLLERNLRRDLELLRDQYLLYLSKNGLYDHNFEELSIPDGVDLGRYCLVNPDAFPKEKKFLLLLGNDANKIEKLSIESNLKPLYIFEKEKAEIRNLLLRIRKLVEEGVGLENIAISTAALERLKPYLDQEAKLYDIPLDYVPGERLLDTVPGRFLSMLSTLYEESFRIEDMKAFFLDPAFSFAKKDGVQSFIMKSIQMSITSAEEECDRYSKISSEDSFDYKKFKSLLSSLMREHDPNKVPIILDYLVTFLLGEERFREWEEESLIFSHTLTKLSEFIAAEKRAVINGYVFESAAFPMFLKAIKEDVYSFRKKSEGIKVYPFSQGAATSFEHHFIITLNEQDSSMLLRSGSFLSEYERAGLDDDVDLSESLLATYSAFNKNVYQSASRETYEGAALPMVALMDRLQKGELPENDSWMSEDSLNRKGNIYPLQSLGYEKAKLAAFRDIEGDQRPGIPLEGTPRLSYSKVTDYEKCPFLYALKYHYGLRELPNYDIVQMDMSIIGERLHSVMERFFRFNGHNPEVYLEDYFDQEMALWKEGQSFFYNRATGKEETRWLSPGSASPSDSLVSYLKVRYLRNMISAAAHIIEESEPIEDGFELKLEHEFDCFGFSLTGFADKVALSSDGDGLIVYDYKSGKKYTKEKLKENSLQFFIYKMILEETMDSVKKGEYLFIKEGKFLTGWENGTTPDDEYIDRLKKASSGIKSGNWAMTLDSESCGGCVFKAICRRKMNIR